MNITELERKFAEKIGTKHCIAMNSGTSALHAALYAMGVDIGDEVISPALTVVMNTFATMYLGAIPIYVDVDPDTFLIDPKEIEKAITPDTKAIQVVGLFGLPCNIEPIMEISKKYGIPVLEDNAQCFLGRHKNGTISGSQSTMAMFSTESSKHISCGEGGFLVTNDTDLALKARKFAGLGYQTLRVDEGRPKLSKELFHMPDFKRHDTIGFNYRMPQLCVEALGPQVENLEEVVNLRIHNAKAFDDVLSKYDFFKAQKSDGYVNSYWTYATLYSGSIPWLELYKRFRANGGEGFHGSLSLPYKELFMQGSPFADVSCPVAEFLQPNLMLFHTNFKTQEALDEQIVALKKTLDTI